MSDLTPPTEPTNVTSVVTQGGGPIHLETGDASLQGEALRALCWGWLGLLLIYAGTVFAPMLFKDVNGGAYDIITKALAIEEKLMIALTSSLMTAVTMQRRS